MEAPHAATLTPRVGLGVAALSACLLMIEVSLTRVFSVTIWYHFAFLAISVALFGAGAASVALYLGQARLEPARTGRTLSLTCAALALVIVVSELVLVQVSSRWTATLLGEVGKLLVIFTAAAAPFVVGGFALGLAMTRHALHVHRLYFWDLVGAALGCLVVIPWMDAVDAPRVLVSTAAVAGVAGALLAGSGPGPGWARGRTLGLTTAAVIVAALLAAPGAFRVRYAKGERLDALRPEFNRWNSYSMVTVLAQHDFRGWGMSPTYRGSLPEQKAVLIDLNALTMLTRFRGDLAEVTSGLHDATAFVHAVHPAPATACVIGAGAGKDVLAALASGARHVTAIELNPLIADGIVRGAYRGYAGGLYDRPDVTLKLGDGRASLRDVRRDLDLVHLSMVDTSAATAAGAYALSENSLYTVEAFRDYLGHLRSGGALSVSSVSLPGLAVGQRLVALAREAVLADGGAPSESVLVLSAPWLALPDAVLHTVIVKRGAWTDEERARARRRADELGFRLAYLPGQPPPESQSERMLSTILNVRGAAELDRALEAWPVDVSATTDDRPYFFYQNRLSDLVAMLAPSQRTQAYPFGNGLFVLAKVLLIAVVMVVGCMLAPLALSARGRGEGRGLALDVSFVTLLGVGFMALEIAMVQRVTLYLGRPSDGLAVVLFVLLASGGLGSAWARRFSSATRARRLALSLLALVAYVTLLSQSGAMARLFQATSALSLTARLVIASAVLAPLGALLGVALPTWLARAAERAPGRVPWLWGINGAASVLGSVLATLVAMHAGISGALWLGVASYALAAATAAWCARSPEVVAPSAALR